MDAGLIIQHAGAAMRSRAAERDQAAERSMARTVAIYNAMTGAGMSELDGWRFMLALKLARSAQGACRLDDYVDLAAYAALAGECAGCDDVGA